MIRIPVKPLSNNRAWKVTANPKRGVYVYKSADYLKFEKEVKEILDNYDFIHLPDEGYLKFEATFGVSMRMDLDNCVKNFMDVLESYYGFKDVRVDEIHIKKDRVKRGAEYIEFNLRPLDEEDITIVETPAKYFKYEFDGSNQYEIIGVVIKILRDLGKPDECEQFFDEAVEEEYDVLVRKLVPKYVGDRVIFYPQGEKNE